MIKYLVSVFTLALIAYTQLLAPCFSINSYPISKAERPIHAQFQDAAAADVQTFLIAEEENKEDERMSGKKLSERMTAFSFTYIQSFILEYKAPATQDQTSPVSFTPESLQISFCVLRI